jgi:very-short-patch-repair endonuclease
MAHQRISGGTCDKQRRETLLMRGFKIIRMPQPGVGFMRNAW